MIWIAHWGISKLKQRRKILLIDYTGIYSFSKLQIDLHMLNFPILLHIIKLIYKIFKDSLKRRWQVYQDKNKFKGFNWLIWFDFLFEINKYKIFVEHCDSSHSIQLTFIVKTTSRLNIDWIQENESFLC